MRVGPNFLHREFPGANLQKRAVCLWVQLEQLAGERTDCRPWWGLIFGRPWQATGEEPLVGPPPAVGPVSQHDGRDFPQKGGLFGDEMGILLIPGDRYSAQRRGLTGEPEKIAVLADLGAVNEPLATDPARKNLLLFGRWVDAEFITGPSLDPPPGASRLARGMRSVLFKRHKSKNRTV